MKTKLSLIELIEYFSFSTISRSSEFIEISNQVNRYLIYLNENQEYQVFCLASFQLINAYQLFFRHSVVSSEEELYHELLQYSNFETTPKYIDLSNLKVTNLNIVISYFLGSKGTHQLSHNIIDLPEHLFSEISKSNEHNLFASRRRSLVPAPYSDLFSSFQPKSTHLLSFFTKANLNGKSLNGLVTFNQHDFYLHGRGGYKVISEKDTELVDLFFSPVTVLSNYLSLTQHTILLCDLNDANILLVGKKFKFSNLRPNIREESVLDWIQFYRFAFFYLKICGLPISYSSNRNDFSLTIPEATISGQIEPIDFNNKLKVFSLQFDSTEQTIAEIPQDVFSAFSSFQIFEVSSSYHSIRQKKSKVWTLKGIHHPLIYSKLYYLLKEVFDYDLKETIV